MLPPIPAPCYKTLIKDAIIETIIPTLPIPNNPSTAGARDAAVEAVNSNAAPPATTGKFTENTVDYRIRI